MITMVRIAIPTSAGRVIRDCATARNLLIIVLVLFMALSFLL